MNKNKRKQVVPKDETKEVMFIRVVTPRINRAVKFISLIGNCAGTGYAYSDEQREQLILTLRREVDLLESRYKRVKEVETKFEFSK